LTLPQPHSWSTSLGIDELDACGLERAADGVIVDAGELGHAVGELGAADGRTDPYQRKTG
jgi:hypothetical protein